MSAKLCRTADRPSPPIACRKLATSCAPNSGALKISARASTGSVGARGAIPRIGAATPGRIMRILLANGRKLDVRGPANGSRGNYRGAVKRTGRKAGAGVARHSGGDAGDQGDSWGPGGGFRSIRLPRSRRTGSATTDDYSSKTAILQRRTATAP